MGLPISLESRKSLLFVGAHPDDIVIASSGLLLRNKGKSYVVTVTDGAPLFKESYPKKDIDAKTYEGPDSFRKVRIQNDISALSHLGIFESRYRNFFIPDQDTYKNIDFIIDMLADTCQTHSVDAIITHEYPQGHPDHEVVNFCSHFVANLHHIEVHEFPLYSADAEGRTYFGGFMGTAPGTPWNIILTTPEFVSKVNAMKEYKSEYSYLENLGRRETFKLVTRTMGSYFAPENEVDKYIKWIIGNNPAKVRSIFNDFLKRKEVSDD